MNNPTNFSQSNANEQDTSIHEITSKIELLALQISSIREKSSQKREELTNSLNELKLKKSRTQEEAAVNKAIQDLDMQVENDVNLLQGEIEISQNAKNLKSYQSFFDRLEGHRIFFEESIQQGEMLLAKEIEKFTFEETGLLLFIDSISCNPDGSEANSVSNIENQDMNLSKKQLEELKYNSVLQRQKIIKSMTQSQDKLTLVYQELNKIQTQLVNHQNISNKLQENQKSYQLLNKIQLAKTLLEDSQEEQKQEEGEQQQEEGEQKKEEGEQQQVSVPLLQNEQIDFDEDDTINLEMKKEREYVNQLSEAQKVSEALRTQIKQ